MLEGFFLTNTTTIIGACQEQSLMKLAQIKGGKSGFLSKAHPRNKDQISEEDFTGFSKVHFGKKAQRFGVFCKTRY
jgi:hypothetical protein